MFIEIVLCWKGTTLAMVDCSSCRFIYKHPTALRSFSCFMQAGYHRVGAPGDKHRLTNKKLMIKLYFAGNLLNS